MEGIINKANEGKQNELHHDVGLFFVVACEFIDSIQFQCDANNNLFIDLYVLLLVLLHELVKTMTFDFHKMRQHNY